MSILKSVAQMALVLAGLNLLTGCALTTAKIGLDYVSKPNVIHIPGATNAAVKVVVVDQRRVNNSVGRKINGFGDEMAPIVATNSVPDLIQHAIEIELVNRGFKLGAGDTVTVVGELAKFYNEFKTGFASGTATAELEMNVTIRNAAGTIVYSRLVDGQGIVPNIQLASGANAQIALECALENGIDTLFDDPLFTETLLKTFSRQQASQRRQ